MAKTEKNNSNDSHNGGKQHPNNPPENQKMDFEGELNPLWIKEGVDQEAVLFADKFGSFLVKNNMTTSQIRNVFGEIKRIQIKGFEKEKPGFYLLKPKMAYAASRVDRKKAKGINEFKKVFDKAHVQVQDENKYMNFVDLFEAILAYHKAHGGKDNI